MDYQEYADKAYEKIKEYGSPITIRHSGGRIYNPETNTYSDSSTTVSGVAIQRNYNQRDIDGTNIRMGDVQFMCSLPSKPFTNDTISFGNKTFTVINVMSMNPNGNTDIFFNIQAR